MTQIETLVVDGILVVDKRHDDDAARHVERAALLTARHPGVVEELPAARDVLRLAHAGTTLEHVVIDDVEQVAGLLVAIGATVADLHARGIAHRRLSPDHVVVDATGRPRLCGLRAAGPAEPTERADDVASLADLGTALLDELAERSGKAGAKRHQRALRSVLDAASATDPGRRLTAAQFVAAVRRAVPDLDLPATPGAPPQAPDTAAPDRPDRSGGDPFDSYGWTDGELDALRADLEDGDADEFDADPSPATAASTAATASATEGPSGSVTGSVTGAATEAATGTPDGASTAATDGAPGAATDAATPTVAAPSSRPNTTRAPRALHLAAEDDPDPDTVDDAPTASPWMRARRVLVPAAVVAVAVLGAAQFGLFGGDDAPRTAAAVTLDSTAATTPTSTPSGPSGGSRDVPGIPLGCDVVPTPGPDVDDDGCPDTVLLVGRIATLGERLVEIGIEGDQVILADVDCGGLVTPVALRPSDGSVFVFRSWNFDAPVEVTAHTRVPGGTSLHTESCATAQVTDDDGAITNVPLQ